MQSAELSEAVAQIPRPIAVEVVQEAVASAKDLLRSRQAESLTMAELHDAIRRAISTVKRTEMTPVINATGIIVHTNLGRAPLSDELFESARRIVRGYSNVEFDLARGVRGKRGVACERYLAACAGSEAATVVNNCAAALFLMLNTLANRRRVVISRGELVQIGGGFRIPDILRRSGAKLVEVGTTNITGLADYESALQAGGGLILKVHKSNFVQTGFTQEVSLRDLAPLAKRYEAPLINDLGSGVLIPTGPTVGYDEPTVQQSVKDGADLTSFSGAKPLGGVQAGLIVGRTALVAKVKKNPLFRAMRVDKIVFAMLERLMTVYLNGTHQSDMRLWSMLSVKEADLYRRAKALLRDLGNPPGLAVESTGAFVGGGALPGSEIPSVGLVFSPEFGANRLAEHFRRWEPPIIGRVDSDRFTLDLRSVFDDQLPVLAAAVRASLE